MIINIFKGIKTGIKIVEEARIIMVWSGHETKAQTT